MNGLLWGQMVLFVGIGGICMFISEKDFIKVGKPKISWDGNSYLMRVYCNIGSDYTQFSFTFDFERFLFLYKECRGRLKLIEGNGYYDKHGDYHMSYFDFARKVLNGCGEIEVIELFAMIVKLYQLNPTVCRQAIHQRKKHKRKIELQLKKSMVDKVKYGKSEMGGTRVRGTGKKAGLVADKERMEVLNGLMNQCVSESARTHSLMLFDEYKLLYIQWEVASGLRAGYGSYMGRAKEKALFMKYKALVEAAQQR